MREKFPIREQDLDFYEKFEKLQKENEELKEKNKKAEEKINELEKEIFDLRIDLRTGLGRDIIYYRTLNKKIEESIKKYNLQSYLEKESLTEEDIKELNKIQLHIVHGDIRGLNKYNQDPEIIRCYGGEPYKAGDEILEETGKIIREIESKLNIKGFRIGGDELALLCEGLTKEEVNEIIAEFIEKQSKIEIKGADLSPAINCGSASFAEAIEAYIKVFSVKEREEFLLSPEKQAKKIQELFTAIAARRAMIAKCIGHLFLLTDLLATKPEIFENNICYFQKSIFGLTKKYIKKELVPIYSDKEKMRKKVLKIVKERLEIKTTEEKKQRLKQLEVMTEIADRILIFNKG